MARTPITYGIPTTNVFRAWIKTTEDALLIFEAARQGIVPRVTRRFHEVEKYATLKSGAVVVFTEEESGIKRWTDPFVWSASRVMGNFVCFFHSFLLSLSICPFVRLFVLGGFVRILDFDGLICFSFFFLLGCVDDLSGERRS